MRRWVLIPFPFLALWMGVAYAFGAPVRTATPSFAAAKSIAPITDWGLVFIAGAIVMIVALLARDARIVAGALFLGGTLYTWWAVIFASAAIYDDRASLNGPAIYAVIAFFHYVNAWRIRRSQP